MAGHSEWSNIKHRKEAQDKKKSKLYAKLGKRIAKAVRDADDGDPETNASLKAAIDDAKKKGLPKDNIEKAIARGLGEDVDEEELERGVYEGVGPEGSAFIIEVETDNRNRTVSEMRTILDEFGGELGDNGSIMWQFKRQGQLLIEDPSDIEELELTAIDLGAVDFEEEEGQVSIFTQPADLHNTQTGLEDAGYGVDDSRIMFRPNNKRDIRDRELAEKLTELKEKLENLEDVESIFPNYEIDSNLKKEIET